MTPDQGSSETMPGRSPAGPGSAAAEPAGWAADDLLPEAPPPPAMPRPAVTATTAARTARRLRRSLAWLLAGAIALPASILGAGAWLAWTAQWREAGVELARAAEAAADYSARSLLNYSIAASRVDDLLRGLTDAEIRDREAELHHELRALVTQLPQASAAYVLDRQGMPLVAADRLPVPQVSFAQDRDYFAALAAPGAPPVHVSQVYTGRFEGRRFFAVSRRRSNTGNPPQPDGFDGLVNLSVEPAPLADGLRRLTATSGDAIALIRADGAMLARTRDAEGPFPTLPPGSQFRRHAEAGTLAATYHATAAIGGEPQLIALRRLEQLPVYVAVIRPRSAIVAAWWEAVRPQVGIGLPAMLALLGLALLVRRSQLDLIAANDTLEARVADRAATLEEVSQALDLTPCMITDLRGRVSHWSEGCVRLYGYSRDEALGRMVTELLATEFPPGGRQGLLAALLRHGQWQGELRQVRRDGTRIVTGTQWTLRLDPLTGAPMSIVSTRTDLSALRQAERALSRSEARLHRAQEASGVVAFEVAEDGQVMADAALPGLFGLSPATVPTVGRCLGRLHRPDRAAALALRSRLAAAGGAFSLEFRVALADGAERWLLARGEATADPAGGANPRMLAGIILDVTERRAAETALADSGERLRLAQAAAGFGIYDHDLPSGRVTWDRRMRAFWDLPDDLPVTNRVFLAGLHPDDRALRRDAVRNALDPAGPGTYQVEYRVIGRQDGQERWIATTGQVRFAQGQPVRLTGLAMDITARKRTEQRNELLMREVDHRAKNALAVVQAALRLSRAESPAELVRIVEGRVAALARAQTILAQRRWEGAELQDLLQGELAPFLTGIRRDAPRAELAGPAVTVAAHAAQPLCMAIHELATNAMKYGALSRAGGLLQVTWRLDPAKRSLVLAWRESGGPDIATLPAGRGFGSRVIEQTVQGQLGGAVRRRWLAEGLACDIEVPLSRSGAAKALVLDGEAAAA